MRTPVAHRGHHVLLLCWSAKGGVGTTVVAAGLALLSVHHAPTTIIDLQGDLPAALGVAEPPGPGVAAWLDAPSAPSGSLLRLGAPVVDGLHLVHAGGLLASQLDETSWHRLIASALVADAGSVVIIDAGSQPPSPDACAAATASILVVRPCYLTLRRCIPVASAATGAVLVAEPGRALDRADVERALGVPVMAEVPWDPAIARAVDAGLLAARLPLGLSRSLRAVTWDRAA